MKDLLGYCDIEEFKALYTASAMYNLRLDAEHFSGYNDEDLYSKTLAILSCGKAARNLKHYIQLLQCTICDSMLNTFLVIMTRICIPKL